MDDNVISAGPDDAIGMMSFLFLCDYELKAQYKLELHAHPNEVLSLFGEDEPNMRRKAKLRESLNLAIREPESSHT